MTIRDLFQKIDRSLASIGQAILDTELQTVFELLKGIFFLLVVSFVLAGAYEGIKWLLRYEVEIEEDKWY